MSGWISLHRKIMDHPFYTEKRKFSRYEAWIDLLMLANHQDNKFMHGNQLVEVKRGSFITSELKLMERWDWGKEKLRAYLNLLKTDGMITKVATTKQTTITICNYDRYSSKPDRNEPSDTNGLGLSADRWQTAGRLLADCEPYTNNNDLIMINNDKEKDTTATTAPNPFKLFELEGFGTLSSTIGEKIGYMIDDYSEPWVCEAMKEAAYYGKRNLPYVKSILERYKTSGIDEPWNSEKIKPFPRGGQQNAKHGTGHAGRTDAELNALSL